MTGKQQRQRVAAHALRRAVAVLTLLAGLVAMHALTVGHDPVVTGTVAIGAPDMAAGGGHIHLAGPEHPHQAAAHSTAAEGAAPDAAAQAMNLSDSCVGCAHDPGSSHGGSHLLNICLAVLLAGAVTLALVAARRSRPDRGPAVAAGARVVVSQLTAPRPPSLFRPCVLRT